MKNLTKTFLLIIIGISIAGCSDPEEVEKIVEVEKEVPIPGTPSSLNPSGTGQPINGTISFLSANKVASTYYTFIMGRNSSETSSSNETYNLTSTSFTYFDLGYGTTYYYWVTAHNDKGTSGTSSSSFETRAGPVVVGKPHTPTPATGLTNVPTRGTLSFVKGDNTPSDATFRISITRGRSSNRVQVLSGQYIGVNTNYIYSFENSSAYYSWSIETYRGRTLLATSPTWSFTTVSSSSYIPTSPYPSSRATGVSRSGALSFTKHADAPNNVNYVLHFGRSSTFTATTTVTYGLGTANSHVYSLNGLNSLTANTRYYWRVAAYQNGRLLGNSSTWYFTTGTN